MGREDIDNLRKFLRRIPPVWWISKPLLSRIETAVGKGVGISSGEGRE